MAAKTYVLYFDEQDLKRLDMACFTLHYLSEHAADWDKLQGGLAALTEHACEQMECLSGVFYDAVYRGRLTERGC